MLREKLSATGVNVGAISGNVTVKSIVLTNPRYTGPDRQFTGASIVLGIPGSSDVTLSFGPVSISGSSIKYPFINEILGLGPKFSMLALRDHGKNWTIAGVRYGHGAGLSQIGCYQMALEGKNYKDMLKFYYNVGSSSNLVVMPWNAGTGTEKGATGYTVTSVAKAGSVNTPGSTLNVRSGPATGYSVSSSLKDKAKVAINGQVADWWRIDLGGGKTGFVNGAFIKLDADSQTPPPETNTKTGKVNTPGSTLNVRSGPGTTNTIIGNLSHGASVTVNTENSAWYKLTYNGNTGYVSSAFITLDSTQTTNPNQPKTVYVNTPGSTLNVRSGPGTGHAVIGNLSHGAKITVTDENKEWYKLTFDGKTGYVSKAWTKADNTQTTSTVPQSKTVYVNTPGSTLNVRSGPGTTYPTLGNLKHGEKITVTEENSSWYKLTYDGKTGYVNKSYVKDEQTAVTTAFPKTGTVNAVGGVNIRSGPGTNYKIISGLANGAKVTVIKESEGWYRIENGNTEAWIKATYVKLN
jgi:uncharacterized protein YgiM (DUF1202 family)